MAFTQVEGSGETGNWCLHTASDLTDVQQLGAAGVRQGHETPHPPLSSLASWPLRAP